MKLIYSVFFIFISIIASAQPEAHYDFENDANDLEGNHDGTAVGDVVWSTSQKLEGSYSANFYQAPAFIKSNNTIDFTATGVTINFGVFTYNTSGKRVVFSNQDNSTSEGMTIYLDLDNKRLEVACHNGSSSGSAYSADNSLPSTSTWYYCSVKMVDADAADVIIYVNGVESGTDQTALASAAVNDTISIGGFRDESGTLYDRVDNLSIYLEGLAEDSIVHLYDNRTTAHTVLLTGAPAPSTYTQYLLMYDDGTQYNPFYDFINYDPTYDPDDYVADATGYGYDSTYALAAKQYYAIPEDVDNDDYVGYWLKNLTWRSGNTITYAIEDDPLSAFAITKVSNDSAIITVSDATKINSKIVQQDTTVNLIISTIDAVMGYEIDTAVIRIKENSYSYFFDYDAGAGGDGTRDTPFDDLSADVSINDLEGYGFFIKRGNLLTNEYVAFNTHIASSAHPTLVSAYGTGADPHWYGSNTTTRPMSFGYLTGDNNATNETNQRAQYIYIHGQKFSHYAGDVKAVRTSNNIGFYNFTSNNMDRTGAGEGTHFVINTSSFADSTTNYPFAFVNGRMDTLTNGDPVSYIKTGVGPILFQNIYFGPYIDPLLVDGDDDVYQLRMASGHGNTVQHCWFDNTDNDVWVNIQLRTDNTLVLDNVFEGNARWCPIHVIFQTEVEGYAESTPDSVEIRNNEIPAGTTFYASGIKVSTGSFGHVSDHIYIRDNFMPSEDMESYAVTIDNGADINIERNTIRDSEGIYTSAGSGYTVKYNLGFDITTNFFYGAGGNTISIYNNTTNGIMNLNATTIETVRNNISGTISSASTSSNNISYNASLFEDAVSEDFRLDAGASTAIDQGYDMGATYDIVGTAVPQNGSTDIGAYEYTP